jgi:hypothetical protein
LPDNNRAGHTIFCSSNTAYYPIKIKAATPAQEKLVICSLINELRTKMALDLDANPSLERGMALQARHRKSVDFLIVGSSNAQRLMTALSEMGYSVGLSHSANLRIYRGSTDLLMTQTQEAIKDLDPGTVIYHLLDNSIFCARDWDGSRRPPRRMEDGKYHVMGELQVDVKDVQRDNFNEIKPLLDLAGKCNAIMVAPMPRYLINSCCDDRRHITNRGDSNFKTTMTVALADAKQNIKDFLFHSGKRNLKVLDPNIIINSMPGDEVWGPDPVHPLPRVYAKLADSVVKLAASMKEGQDHKRRRTDSEDGGGSSGSRRRDTCGSNNGSYRSRGGPPSQYSAGRAGGRGRGWGPQNNGRARGRSLGCRPGGRWRGRN